jgi:HAD superfamily phosphatase (TIGR01668 family)
MWITPWANAPSIDCVNIDALWNRGIRGLLLDLDNTLVPNHPLHPEYGTVPVAVRAWLDAAQAKGFGLVCVTNNKKLAYCQKAEALLGFPLIPVGQKPWGQGLMQGLRQLDLSSKEVAVIGDRPTTDGLGGHWLHCPVIMVSSLSYPYEPKIYHVLRAMERWIVKRALYPHLVQTP